MGEALILGRAIATLEDTIQPRFQSPAGHRQTVPTNVISIPTVTQPQGVLENPLHGAWQLPRTQSRHRDHLSAATQQVGHTGLMHGAGKTPVDAPSVPHQKAVEVGPQHGGRWLEPAPRLNRIHRAGPRARLTATTTRSTTFHPKGTKTLNNYSERFPHPP